jgi:hypothetical protein
VQQKKFELVGILARTEGCGNAPQEKKFLMKLSVAQSDNFRHPSILTIVMPGARDHCFTRGAAALASACAACTCVDFKL